MIRRAAAGAVIALTLALACAPLDAEAAQQTPRSQFDLPETLHEPALGWSMRHAADWRRFEAAPHAVGLSGAPGSEAFYATVTVVNLLSPRPGEPEAGAQAAMQEYLDGLGRERGDLSLLHQAPFNYRKDDLTLDGFQTVLEFDGRVEPSRQWLVSLPRANGTIVHLWIYSAPDHDFEHFLPTARAMLDSWRLLPDPRP